LIEPLTAGAPLAGALASPEAAADGAPADAAVGAVVAPPPLEQAPKVSAAAKARAPRRWMMGMVTR
jgi:hypothetical protein